MINSYLEIQAKQTSKTTIPTVAANNLAIGDGCSWPEEHLGVCTEEGGTAVLFYLLHPIHRTAGLSAESSALSSDFPERQEISVAFAAENAHGRC